MKLEPVVPALEFINNVSTNTSSKKIFRAVFRFLSFHFGTEILFKVPAGLQSFDSDLFGAFLTANHLKSLGIIKEISKKNKSSDEPFMHHYHTTSTRKRGHGTGVDFLGEENALWKSLAEAVERYLWYNSSAFYTKKIVRKPFGKMSGKTMNIFSLAGFSQQQKRNFPILSFNEDTAFGWIRAQSITTRKQTFCPAQLFSFSYAQKNVQTTENSKKNEPMLRWPITTGLATGRCLEEAITKGILESIERDAFMITYLNKISPPALNQEYLSEQDDDISEIIDKFKRYNLEVHLLQIPTDFSVFVIAAVIIDRTGKGSAFSIGASADFDLKTCILDALSESHIVRLGHKNRYNEKIETKNINREGRLTYWANAENLPKIEFIIRGEKIDVDLEESFYKKKNPADYEKYYREKLDLLTSELKNIGYEGYFCELTTKEIRQAGLRSVQVVIPNLQPMHLDESIPYFSGKRLRDIPEKLGFSPAETINQEPHPFP